MKRTSVRNLPVKGKRVLVRVDFNVPLGEDGSVRDTTRIEASLPTIRYLIDRGARVILVSHLGRPKGHRVKHLQLDPVAAELERLLSMPVMKSDDCVGPAVLSLVNRMEEGDVLLLENVRFHRGEEENDPEFVRQLAALADVYVNDAFGTAHRAHASTCGVARVLPSASGLLLDREIEFLSGLQDPDRPFIALLGGAKIADKLGVLQRLAETADGLLIGGAMANTFLVALGHSVGYSLFEKDMLSQARSIVAQAKKRGKTILLPVDVVVAEMKTADAHRQEVIVERIPPGSMIMDIGSLTIERYSEVLAGAGTVFWNGPMGVFELPPFARGTQAMARVLAELEARVVVGGGESVQAIRDLRLEDKVTHVSTGGGAALQFIAGDSLPGIEALQLEPDSRRNEVLIAGNWKMHKTGDEASKFIQQLHRELAEIPEGVAVAIFPSFPLLAGVNEQLKSSPVRLGAQDVHWAREGAFTGAVSPRMLTDLGCSLVIVGHSERRRLFGETDEQIARKVTAAYEEGLRPILCVGETLEDRRAGQAERVVSDQLAAALRDVDLRGRDLWVAYEPLWAIGTGTPAGPEDASHMAGHIRVALNQLHHGAEPRSFGVLYGGSVNPDNAGGFLSAEGIDGLLVGGASLDPHSFALIVASAGQAPDESQVGR